MQNTKEILLEQFNHCYDENGWFVAVRNALDGVTAEQAAWTLDGCDQSIWRLVAHLRYDANVYLQRLKGIDYQHTAANNDETFDPSGEDWDAEFATFEAVLTELRELIAAADESRFDERVLGKPEVTWSQNIADLNAHNAYHAGQILLLRKLQGAWNPKKGVS